MKSGAQNVLRSRRGPIVESKVPRMLSLGEIRALWRGVSKVWIWKLYKRGVLRGHLIGREPGEKRGGRLLFLEADVLDFLRKQGVPVDVSGDDP